MKKIHINIKEVQKLLPKQMKECGLVYRKPDENHPKYKLAKEMCAYEININECDH